MAYGFESSMGFSRAVINASRIMEASGLDRATAAATLGLKAGVLSCEVSDAAGDELDVGDEIPRLEASSSIRGSRDSDREP